MPCLGHSISEGNKVLRNMDWKMAPYTQTFISGFERPLKYLMVAEQVIGWCPQGI